MSHGGHGIASNGWHILGAYTGDVVSAKEYKYAEGINYAELLEIITPSEHRTFTPTEKPFYDPNAPWAHLSREQEDIEKQGIAHALFREISGTDLLQYKQSKKTSIRANTSFQSQSQEVFCNGLRTEHYRNKVAYSFTINEKNQIAFALYNRGISGVEKTVYTENLLVHEQLNHIGRQFLEFFRQRQVPLEQLKYLTLRYSYHTNSTVAQILLTETNKKNIAWKKSDLETFLNQQQDLKGILVSHSNADVRSANTTKDFYELGNIYITEEILGRKYQYHPSQFFQIYPEAFANILKDCEEKLSEIPDHKNYELLDMFSGVGVIGLHLAHLVKNITGVEQSPLSKEQSIVNAQLNGIDNAKFIETKAEDTIEYIKSDQILVVDPPRSGLTKSVTNAIMENRPEYIFYISCNPVTQARDYAELKKVYDTSWSRAYNLFPKTSHVENVILLEIKKP